MCAILIAAAISVLLCLGKYTRTARGIGTLVPARGLIDVMAVTAGTITKMYVRQGDIVGLDDTLVAISAEKSSASLGKTSASITKQLTLERSRLIADLNRLQKLGEQKRSELSADIQTAHAQLDRIDRLAQIRRNVYETALTMSERALPAIEKGYISAVQAQQLKREVMEAETQIVLLDREKLEAKKQLTSQLNAIKQLPLDLSAQRHEIERRIGELDQALAQNEAQRATVLRASAAGTVTSTVALEGQSVMPNQTLLSIVPKDSPLVAQIFVTSGASSFTNSWRTVALRYESYPYQKFGSHNGRIINISQNALTVSQASALLGRPVAEPMYRIVVELDSQSINIDGVPERLKPGMRVDAEIKIERRTLLEWLFEPLYRVKQHFQ